MVLISVLGDFHSNIIPIFYEFHKKITKHILIYDDCKQDVKKATYLIDGFNKFVQKYDLDIELYSEVLDEDNLSDIQNLYKRVSKLAKAKDIYLNATDGLSNINITLGSLVVQNGGKSISFDRFDNEYNLLTKQNMKKCKIQNSLNLKDMFLLKGAKLTYSKERDFIDRKEAVFNILKDSKKYLKLKKLLNKKREFDITPFADIVKSLNKIGKINDLDYIRGLIFEEYCYFLIKDLGFSDVLLNAKVKLSLDENNFVQNEFDILVMENNKICTVECKFRKFVDGESLVYKYDSIRDMIDEDSKVVLVAVGGKNRQQNRYGKEEVQFSRGDFSRAKLHNISIYQKSEFDKNDFKKQFIEFFY